MSTASTDVTRLIHAVQGGDESARRDLWTLLYGELHRLAEGHMARERGQHTLQPTALVHEAWLRLAGDTEGGIANRAHFFGIAAEAMRRILVDHARRRSTARRGGPVRRVELEDVLETGDDATRAAEIQDLDAALARLEATGRHPRKCEVVKLRFFAGLTNEQTAELIGVSVASVKRDWDFAKAWLTREMGAPRQEGRTP